MTYAIIPALNPDPLDLACVVRACRVAELEPFVAWQGKNGYDAFRDDARMGAVGYLHSTHPLGKGGAIKASLSDLGITGQPFVVVDSDLYAIEPYRLDNLRRMIEATPSALVRGAFDHSGRVGRVADALADALPGIGHRDVKVLTGNGGLLSGVQGYGAEVWDRVELSSAPEGYGWDVWVALQGLEAGMRAAIVNVGPRRHRSTGGKHIESVTREVVAAMLEVVSWSA